MWAAVAVTVAVLLAGTALVALFVAAIVLRIMRGPNSRRANLFLALILLSGGIVIAGVSVLPMFYDGPLGPFE